MLDMKFLRENPDIVKQNIKNKFQDEKLPMVDKVIELDEKRRTMQQEADDLRNKKNTLSKQIGALMKEGKKEEAEKIKAEVAKDAARLAELEAAEGPVAEEIQKIMYTIPNIIDPSVPIGKDDTENPIIRISWNASTVLTWMQQDVLRETVSIILWVILQDFTRR